ncbi:MAG: DUF255 domain-containing protein [Bacteroidetes bacterium]|nr:DUF255 domain-containing protein [Bacteroidota bacterium]
MRNPILLFFGVVLMLSLLSFDTTNNGVNFNSAGWSKVSKTARYSKKPIFVFIGSDNCVTSRRMTDVFKNTSVATFFNDNFVSTKMNPEKFWDYMVTTNWGVTKIPTLVIMTPQHKIVKIELGYKNPKNLISSAEEALKEMGINNYTPSELNDESPSSH